MSAEKKTLKEEPFSEKASPKIPEWFKKSVAKFYAKEIKDKELIGVDEFAAFLWHVFTKELNKIFFEGLVAELEEIFEQALASLNDFTTYAVYGDTATNESTEAIEKKPVVVTLENLRDGVLVRLGVEKKETE